MEAKEVKPASSTTSGSPSKMPACIPESAKSIVLNVGGQRFEVLRKNLANYPGSRLWKIAHANTHEEILRVCDRYLAGRDSEADFQPAEYYFDHTYTSFPQILDAYRSGHLHLPPANCAYNTREDLAYWGIDELLVEPCCAVKFYPEIDICVKEIDIEEEEKAREIEREKLEDFGPTWYGKLRKKLWDLFEYPQTSRGAQVSLQRSAPIIFSLPAARFLDYFLELSFFHRNRIAAAPQTFLGFSKLFYY